METKPAFYSAVYFLFVDLEGMVVLVLLDVGASFVRTLCTNAHAVEANRVRGCRGLIGLQLLNICGSTYRNSF